MRKRDHIRDGKGLISEMWKRDHISEMWKRDKLRLEKGIISKMGKKDHIRVGEKGSYF